MSDPNHSQTILRIIKWIVFLLIAYGLWSANVIPTPALISPPKESKKDCDTKEIKSPFASLPFFPIFAPIFQRARG